MKIRLFAPGDNKEHLDVLMAFAHGLNTAAPFHDTEVRRVEEYEECDVAVVFGVGKKNVPCSYARGNVIAQQAAKGLPTLILEKGYVKRDEYYAAGWNGLNNRANFRNRGMPPNRWNELGVERKPWRKRGDEVLVCGQVPSDASVQNVDIINWCAQTVIQVHNMLPGKTIRFRPHPLAKSGTPDMLHAKTSTRSLQCDLDNALFVVTYNSNVGVDAVLNGVPVYVADEGAMAYDVASKMLTRAFMPSDPVMDQWCSNLAYTQWTLDEMREGLPWQHLTRTEQQQAVQ